MANDYDEKQFDEVMKRGQKGGVAREVTYDNTPTAYSSHSNVCRERMFRWRHWPCYNQTSD